MANYNNMTPRQKQWVDSRKRARKNSHNNEYKELNPIQALVSSYVFEGCSRLCVSNISLTKQQKK